MIVAMIIGGISGLMTSAAARGVVTRSMIKDGYPRPFIASVVGLRATYPHPAFDRLSSFMR